MNSRFLTIPIYFSFLFSGTIDPYLISILLYQAGVWRKLTGMILLECPSVIFFCIDLGMFYSIDTTSASFFMVLQLLDKIMQIRQSYCYLLLTTHTYLMSQSGSQRLHSRSHPSQHSARQQPTKQVILQWVAEVLGVSPSGLKVDSMGDGVIYCRLINHYLPSAIPASRMVTEPANHYEASLNLKQVQIALRKMGIEVPVEINKLVKKSFSDNWNFLQQLYRSLNCYTRPAQPIIKTERVSSRVASKRQRQEEKRSIVERQVEEEHEPEGRKLDVPRGGLLVLIDRAKEILLSGVNDPEKVRQIRWLFGLQEVVKIEDDLMG